MAWIKVQDTLPDHRKVVGAAASLKMDKDAFVGKLVRLWLWVLSQREDGCLREADAETVADVMRYRGKPAKLMAALLEAGLLDNTGDGYLIHGWEESMGALLTRREEQRAKTRERVKRHRERTDCVEDRADEDGEEAHRGGACNTDCNADVTRYRSVTETDCNGCVTPDVTVLKRGCNSDVTPTRVRVIDIDDDDNYRADACAHVRVESGVEAACKPGVQVRGGDWEREFEENDLFEEQVERCRRDIREAYATAYGREAYPAEVESILQSAMITGTGLVAGEAVKTAAHYGARSVAVYVRELFRTWQGEGIHTPADLMDYELRRNVLEPREERRRMEALVGCRGGGAI